MGVALSGFPTTESFRPSKGDGLTRELVLFSATPGFSNCGPQISSLCVTGEMIRDAKSRAPTPRFTGSESAFSPNVY